VYGQEAVLPWEITASSRRVEFQNDLNKKVKPKEFQIGDLVWEAVLPLGTKDVAYGKRSPNWHGPYRVDQVLSGNAYMLEELDGVKFPVAVNGQHLKIYFPSMWDGEQ
jgi:hypothetical protein